MSIFCVSSLYGGGVCAEFSGNPYFTQKILLGVLSEKDVTNEAKINSLLDFYTEKGFPFAKIRIDSILTTGESECFFLNIEAGDYVAVNTVSFSGAEITGVSYLLRQSRFESGKMFSVSGSERTAEWLYKSGLFFKRPEWKIIKESSGYGLVFLLKEKKFNELMFMGGYSSTENGNYHSLMLNIKLGNLFGTMRKADVIWEKSGGDAEKIRLAYREPFLLMFPVSTEIRLFQTYKKQLSLHRGFTISEVYDIDTKSSFSFGFSYDKVYPDSLYPGPLNDIVSQKYFAEIQYSTFPYRQPIPECSGWSLSGRLSSVKIDIRDSTEHNGIESNIEAGVLRFFQKNIAFDARISYTHQIFDDEIPYQSRIFFGGVESFRGYREEFFSSDIFIKQSADLILVSRTKDIAFNLFSDFCQYNPAVGNIQKIAGLESLRSYGGGIIYESRSGHVHIQAAFPEKEGLRFGVAHIRYSVSF